jgi:hypothetical protein
MSKKKKVEITPEMVDSFERLVNEFKEDLPPEVLKEAEEAIEVMRTDEETVNVPEPVGEPLKFKELDKELAKATSTVKEDYVKVGFPVLFEGSAAIITKVWERGLVNLTIFHDGSPVPDLKTSVPYGDGPNTWKEIN